ncbi:DUF4384 domain-containing protein [Treponema sp. OttesenSCG-928-L16]|nr:DUF4384 domain-containing protein [Treponema sp. OttesenSCG-928-L16]
MALVNVNTREAYSSYQYVILKDGETFRFYIRSNADCYCYIIGKASDGEILVIREGVLLADVPYYSIEMFTSPPPGLELFQVVVSLDEQKELQFRIDELKADRRSERKRLNLWNEGLRIRQAISTLKENPASPVLMGGASRSMAKRVKATRFSGLRTYVKSVIIRH